MINFYFSSSVARSCLTLFNPTGCSTPCFSVHHQLLELTQNHVHWVGDAVQPSQPLSSISPPAFNLSQHQGFFSNESVFHIRWPKYWSFSFSISPSNEYSRLICLQFKELSRVFSSTSIQKHQFFGAQYSLWSNSHIWTYLPRPTKFSTKQNCL